jgi:hypothetical protein
MKVYVCYYYCKYEGISELGDVFLYKEDAESWKKKNHKGPYDSADFLETEVKE